MRRGERHTWVYCASSNASRFRLIWSRGSARGLLWVRFTAPGCHSKIGYLSVAVAERRVALEYAELNWTISMIVSVSTLRISRYHGLAVETLN